MTVSEIDDILAALKIALISAIKGKSYTINTGGTSRSYSRNDIQQLKTEIQYWENQKEKNENSSRGIPTKFITGID